MSLLAGSAIVLGYAAARGKELYLLGCDVLGSEQVATSGPTVVDVRSGGYWTSVCAGLTVAGLLALTGVFSRRRA